MTKAPRVLLWRTSRHYKKGARALRPKPRQHSSPDSEETATKIIRHVGKKFILQYLVMAQNQNAASCENAKIKLAERFGCTALPAT